MILLSDVEPGRQAKSDLMRFSSAALRSCRYLRQAHRRSPWRGAGKRIDDTVS